MKRVLISAVAAGALLGQLHAVEVYKDGDKSFGVFGTARAILGYGGNTSNTKGYNGEFIAGIQGNSRIGVNFTVGNLFGAALLGVGEATLRGVAGNSGFRQIYAGYKFGDAGQILAGKNELVTSMGGFSSDTWNVDSGLAGFGGAATSTRRFQIAYSVAGLTFSISENDFSTSTVGSRGYEVPRFSLGYEYKDSDIRAKVALSYAYNRVLNTKNAFLLTAGVRPVFGDQYVSALLSYGYNAEKLGEQSRRGASSLKPGFQNFDTFGNSGRGTDNTNIAALALEYGVNLSSDLAFKLGVGYQYAAVKGVPQNEHSYGVFAQLPYKVGAGFNITPQVGYIGTTIATRNGAPTKNEGNVLATVQFALNF